MMYAARVSRYWKVLNIALLLIFLSISLPPWKAAASAPPAGVCASYHTVKATETIQDIAAAYGVTVQALAEANALSNPYIVEIGDSLCTPPPPAVAAALPPIDCIKLRAQVYQHKRITLYAEKLPVKHTYWLKFRPFKFGPWIKVAKVYPKSDGTLVRSFTIPESWRSMPRFQVCLKETTYGYLVCTTANNR